MKQKHYPSIRRLLLTSSFAVGEQALRSSLVLVLLMLVSFAQVRGACAGDYHGQVVDAETGKPIEGAVIVVEWHKKPKISMSDINYFHNARETLTDADGKFVMDSSPGIDWNPFTYIQEPRIIAFYPGYRPFTPAHTEVIEVKDGVKTRDILEAFERGVVVKLRKLSSDQESRRYADTSGFGPIMAPYTVIPNFHRLINVQRKIVGVSELKYP